MSFPRLTVVHTLVLACSVFCTLTAYAQEAEDAPDLSSQEAKFSYAVGAQLGNFLKEGKDLIDMEVMNEAMEKVMEGEELAMSDQEIQMAFQQFQMAVRAKQAEQMNAEGAAFLEANADKPGVEVTGSGLQYKIVREGTGASPDENDMVSVHYRGTFVNGDQFDSSYDRGQPAEFPVNRVIPGWTEGLQMMKEGAKWELYIPYNLAYGEQGREGIPPYATLIFEVELLEVTEQ